MTAQSMKTDILNTVETARHAVAGGVANGLDVVRSEAVDLRDLASQSASEAADALTKGIHIAEKEADIILDAAKQQAAALQKLLTDELRTHPLRSLGIAAAIGLVAGYMSNR